MSPPLQARQTRGPDKNALFNPVLSMFDRQRPVEKGSPNKPTLYATVPACLNRGLFHMHLMELVELVAYAFDGTYCGTCICAWLPSL
jgi:hypothetical protein